MQHVLDIDLDFFVMGAAMLRAPDAGRLDDGEYPPWPVDMALDFLRDSCGLDERVPGFVVEHHDELFGRWRDAIDDGTLDAPFSVTHVGAHADLGLNATDYKHLLTEFVASGLQDRKRPGQHLNEGNFLAYAIACRWVSDLTWVFTEGEGNDIPSFLRPGYDLEVSQIQLPVLTKDQMKDRYWWLDKPRPLRLEPLVPFEAVQRMNYRATGPFDVVCLTRSPSYTPAASDTLFGEIRKRFIDETAFASR